MVFATITAEGYINKQTKQDVKCMFNEDDSACNYGVGIGVLAFLACSIFIVLDAFFPQISNAKERKFIVIGDLGFSGETVFAVDCSCYNKGTLPIKQEVQPIFLSPHSGVDVPVVHLLLCPGQPVVQYPCKFKCHRGCRPGCSGLLLLVDHHLGKPCVLIHASAFHYQNGVSTHWSALR